MGLKCQSKFSISSLTHFSSHNNTNYLPLPIEQSPPDPPQQDTPSCSMPHEQTTRQWTPGPSGTQWFKDLSCGKQKAIPFLILAFDSSELTLPTFVEPSQHNEPPIQGLSPSSEPQVSSHEDTSACEPEPEEALTQSTEEPFSKSPLHLFYYAKLCLTPPLTISSSSHYTPLHNHHWQYTCRIPPAPPIGAKNPNASSPPALRSP
ncbi:hypothetical protein O181_040358 [Austropuccinia psidii MF-1]|uniref:Uncharacterized protein n=1 Tax=Austropuccinia psidii MF-1 TaxID=1389203 RepID=A0A9Q3DF73_9BASI|nr:hypothetical protein [Austropuccinia psidii MF-1]